MIALFLTAGTYVFGVLEMTLKLVVLVLVDQELLLKSFGNDISIGLEMTFPKLWKTRGKARARPRKVAPARNFVSFIFGNAKICSFRNVGSIIGLSNFGNVIAKATNP